MEVLNVEIIWFMNIDTMETIHSKQQVLLFLIIKGIEKRLKHLNPNMAILMMISITVLHLKMHVHQHKTNVHFQKIVRAIQIFSNGTYDSDYFIHWIKQSSTKQSCCKLFYLLKFQLFQYHYLHVVSCLRTLQDWW